MNPLRRETETPCGLASWSVEPVPPLGCSLHPRARSRMSFFDPTGNGLEKRLWGGCHDTVQQRFTSLVEDAKVHGTGVEIDTTVKRVLGGVESH